MLQIPIVDTRKKKTNVASTTRWFDQKQEFSQVPTITSDFNLTSMLKRLKGIPKRTAILGQTEDGLPILLNLTDPRPGSLLIPADRESGKTEILMSLASSLARLNRPEDVRFAVISESPTEWEDLAQRYPSHFLDIVSNNQVAAEQLILHLCDLLEGRQNGGRVGTGYVLLFDGLETITRMSSDVQANFQWLVRLGARFQIWTVASVESGKFLALYRFADIFRTQIVGTIRDTTVAARLLPPRFQKNSHMGARKQFTVRIHQNWFQFVVPEINA